jgi:hypothetical protein
MNTNSSMHNIVISLSIGEQAIHFDNKIVLNWGRHGVVSSMHLIDKQHKFLFVIHKESFPDLNSLMM